jgi:hypothetical protein
MRTLVCLLAVGLLATSGRTDETKPKEIAFQIHNGYFESNRSGLKGESSFLAFTDPEEFGKVFGVGFVMGKRPNVIAKDAWGKIFVAAAIKRGNSLWEYQVEKVTVTGDRLTVRYKATEKPGGGTASFASPLIVSVEKKDCKEVVFVENGKEVAIVKPGK